MKPRAPRTSGEDSAQLRLDWTGKEGVDRSVNVSPTQSSSAPALVQELPWDFKTTFPLPTAEAIDEGVILEEDATPDGIRSIHEEHARAALATLRTLDAVLEARRRGLDPETGATPRTAAGRERLQRRLEDEPSRLEHAFGVLIDVYATAFGAEAAEAFAKAIRAWHAGIEVIAAPRPVPRPSTTIKTAAIEAEVRPGLSRSSRVVAQLPVPKPLPVAVAAGRFGREEDGVNVRPGPHEVRAITEQHAEKLADLLRASRAAQGARSSAERQGIEEQYTAGIAAYAEDFGERAAEQLDAHVRRIVHQELAPAGSRSRRR